MHLSTTEQRKSLLIVSDLLSQRQQQFSYPLLPDAWGTPILEELVAMPEAERVPWLALLYHCAKANVAVPPVHWLEHTHTLRASIGSEGCDRTIHRWISLFSDKKGSRMDDANSDILRGLIWCCTGSADRLLASLLADAAIEGYRKLSGLGPRAPKVAGAAVQTLESMPGMYAISQLERVRLNVKQPSYQALIGRSLDALARRENMTRIDLEELTVPTFDLQDGRVLFPSDSFTAQIMVDGRNAHVQWLDEHGEPYKHLPAAIKRSLKKEMKDLQRLSGDIEHMLSAQRQRLEQLPLSERQWTLANWQERYLFHPLLGLLVKRLIWQFRVGEQVLQGIWYEGRLVDVQNTPLEFPAETLVSLWHPLMSSADEVQRWRLWLEEWQVTQPFKQAHREIYLLTDAERGTGDYSMRFAGHFIGQYQFSALARVRGWNFSLLIDYAEANDGPATLHLAHWNLQAEFEVRGHLGDADGGSYPYVTSGAVRFWPIQPEQFPRHYMPLEQVPPILFSEVMRDVDLFVSVTNIGMNPYDSYGESALQHYWKTYNQSELSLSAEERKALLTRLIPRLPIAERCSFEDRFLKVRGDLRSYRIHLGSGNILMEPDDHYLCIVFNLKKQGSAGGQYFLPFEGDAILALILSKAFLLADDTHITDPSILSQIKSQRSPMR